MVTPPKAGAPSLDGPGEAAPVIRSLTRQLAKSVDKVEDALKQHKPNCFELFRDELLATVRRELRADLERRLQHMHESQEKLRAEMRAEIRAEMRVEIMALQLGALHRQVGRRFDDRNRLERTDSPRSAPPPRSAHAQLTLWFPAPS